MGKCSVDDCEDPPADDITYFNFPASRALRRRWIAAVSPGLRPRPGAVVCSRHFPAEECTLARGRTRLRPAAVPSLMLGSRAKRDRSDSSSSDSRPIIDIRRKTDNTTSDTEANTTDKTEKKQHGDTDIANNLKDGDKIEVEINFEKPEKSNKSKSQRTKRKNLHDKLKELRNKKESLDKGESSSKRDKREDVKDTGEGEKDKDSGENGSDDEERARESEDRVQEKTGEEKDLLEDKDRGSEESSSSQDKSAVSTTTNPGPRTIDKPEDIDKAEDIEELLTNYHILQDRPLNIHAHAPVFVEISVDKDKQVSEADKNDCLMVMESVEVELDPRELMLHSPDHDATEGGGHGKEDPISLLTSSDEDDVIIEEPHIDTVEVSDETDEDDMPLVKLLKRRRAEKKSHLAKANLAKANLAKAHLANGDADIAKLLWGMYEYYCVQCHFTTSSGTEYRRHTASHAKVLMMCQICGYMTASETQFTKHEKQHGEKKYKCHLCSYKAKHNMSLLYHLKGHKAEDFIKKAELASLKEARSSGRVFECRNCSYTSKKRCDLKRHVTRRHKKDHDEDFVP